MTVITCFATGDVRGILAACRNTVVTRSAGTYDLRVVDHIHRRPYVGVVAVLANIRRLYVREILTGSSYAVVAAAAAIRDIGVVEVGW